MCFCVRIDLNQTRYSGMSVSQQNSIRRIAYKYYTRGRQLPRVSRVNIDPYDYKLAFNTYIHDTLQTQC